MNRRLTRMFFTSALLAAAAGLAACASPMAPLPEYITATDTTTMTLHALIGEQWGIGVAAIVTGNIDLPQGEFVYKVDNVKVLKVSVQSFDRLPGFSFESNLPTTTFRQTLNATPIALGTAKLTVWHPSNSNLKKVFKFEVSQWREGCTSANGFSPVTGEPCTNSATVVSARLVHSIIFQ